MAPLDVLTAQADVASREAGILAAEASVRANEDALKVLINLSADEERGLREIVALDQPAFDESKIELDQALAVAMEKRPDLQISRSAQEYGHRLPTPRTSFPDLLNAPEPAVRDAALRERECFGGPYRRSWIAGCLKDFNSVPELEVLDLNSI
jgi:hypothetical protein